MTLKNFFKGKALVFVALLIILGIVAVIVCYFKPDVAEPIENINDYKTINYVIEGQSTQLQYFGNEFRSDLNGDGREDITFIATQQPGGSGTFYYVVSALNTEQGYVGSEGLLLGDRIAPQSTEKGRDTIVVVNYADRAPGESFAVSPSVGKSLWLYLDPKTLQFGEVQKDFEGEADPARMSLGMQTWKWISVLYSDGREVVGVNKPFSLTFKTDGTFSATTDCNGVGGDYTVKGNSIVFSNMISTLMYCEGSKENEFTSALSKVESYHFTSLGELVFDLKLDSGIMVFK